MSSPADQLASIKTPQPVASAAAATRSGTGSSDIVAQAEMDARLAGNQENLYPQATPPVVADQTSSAQRNISATQNSIFANAGANPQSSEQQGVNAAQSSIFSGAADELPRTTGGIPLPDAKTVSEVQDLALAGMPVPQEMQQVASADPAADPAVASLSSTQQVQPAISPAGDASAGNVQGSAEQPVAKTKPRKKYKTLADLFRRSSDEDEAEEFNNERFSKKVMVNTAGIPNMGTANADALPGVGLNAMMPVGQIGGEEGGEGGGNVQLASLSGMTRIAPNGLWTQTDQVEVRCLRPQLLGVLKTVEIHYGKPVMVTSGYRDPGHNLVAGGARHSLHTLCAAADIQVEGVSKWELAEFLRSIPGRGGVGTYCHTESVHIDIGTERDWNWRCRRGKRRLF